MALGASQRTLQSLCLKELGLNRDELIGLAYSLQEAGAKKWGEISRQSPRGATLLSAAMTAGAVDGSVRPKIVDHARSLKPAKIFIEGVQDVVGRSQVTESMVDQILANVPWPADYQAVSQVLDLVDTSNGAGERHGLVDALCQETAQRTTGGGPGDVVLARQLALGSPDLARELLTNNLLPNWLERLCEIAVGQGGRTRDPSVEPILLVARLPEPVAALVVILVEYLGNNPANWASIRPVFRHLDRLASVGEFGGFPTLRPASSSLHRLRLDLSVANGYDSQLQMEYEASGEGAKSIRQLMRGFGLFCELLEMAREYGAPIDCLPRGLAGDGASSKWESVRPDLTPEPEAYRMLLAMAPALLVNEDPKIVRLLLLDLVIPSRPYVVLTLERSGWIEEQEGVVIHIRPGARHKRGRGTVFLPAPLRDLYGIGPDWLPIHADEQPSPATLTIYQAALRGLLTRFIDSTGLTLPLHPYIARRGLLQLLRHQLRFPDIAVSTAYLDHDSPGTRANYDRAIQREVINVLNGL